MLQRLLTKEYELGVEIRENFGICRTDLQFRSYGITMPEEFIIMVLPGNNRTKLILELFYNKEVTFETHAEVIKDILISNENNAGVYRPADNMM